MPQKNDLQLLGEALRDESGPLMDFVRKRESDPHKWDRALQRTLRGENPWPEKVLVRAVEPKVSNLFTVVRRRELPQIPEFNPRDKFPKLGIYQWMGGDEAFPIGYTDSSLSDMFEKGRVEPIRGKEKLLFRSLMRDATFEEMLNVLQDEKQEVSLGRAFQMAKEQARGQKGDLLVNGHANLFFIEKTGMVLYVVFNVCMKAWYFFAFSEKSSGVWSAGSQLIA